MADDVAITAGAGTAIATDEASGRHFQRVKLVDSTADSTDPTGVAANPMRVDPTGTTPQPTSWVDFDNVTVNTTGWNFPLPVVLPNTSTVNVGTIASDLAIYGELVTINLTGPSDGIWGTDIVTLPWAGMLMLTVRSFGGTPTIAAYGAAMSNGNGGTYDQQLPLVVPSAGGLAVEATFTPGTGMRYFYLPCTPPYLEIRATTGGNSDPCVADLLAVPMPPSFTLVAT